jgi:hypothetical protein
MKKRWVWIGLASAGFVVGGYLFIPRGLVKALREPSAVASSREAPAGAPAVIKKMKPIQDFDGHRVAKDVVAGAENVSPPTFADRVQAIKQELTSCGFDGKANIFYLRLRDGEMDIDALREFLKSNAGLYARMEILLENQGGNVAFSSREAEREADFVFHRMAKYLLLKSHYDLFSGNSTLAVRDAEKLLALASALEGSDGSLYMQSAANRSRAFFQQTALKVLDRSGGDNRLLQTLHDALSRHAASVEEPARMMDADQRYQKVELLYRWERFKAEEADGVDPSLLKMFETNVAEEFEAFYTVLKATAGEPWNNRLEMLQLFKERSENASTELYFYHKESLSADIANSMPETFMTSMALENFGGMVATLQRKYETVAYQNVLNAVVALKRAKNDGRTITSLNDLMPDYLSKLPGDPFSGNILMYDAGSGIVASIGPKQFGGLSTPRGQLLQKIEYREPIFLFSKN